MNKTIKKDLIIVLLYILASTIIEMVTFYSLGFGYSPKYIWFNLAFWLASGMFVIIFPNVVKIIICSIILLIQVVIGVVNSTLFYTNGEVFYLETIKQAQAGVRVATPDVFDLKCIAILIVVLILAVIGFVLIQTLYKVNEEDKINRKILPLLFLMAFSCPLGAGINQITFDKLNSSINNLSNWQGLSLNNGVSKEDISEALMEVSDEQYLFENLNIGVTGLKNFGTFGFYLKNLTNLLTSEDEGNAETEIEKTINYLNSGELVATNINSSGGNNVITILLETTAWYMIDPYMTPYLYALSNTSADTLIENNDLKYIADNSLKLMNYHGRYSTNISEQLMLVGSYPYENEAYYSLYNTDAASMNFDFSLANAIQNTYGEDVATSYYHSGSKTIYFREYIMPAYGFDNTYLLEHLDKITGYEIDQFYDLVLDTDFIRAYSDEMLVEDNQFYTHISTITTHGSYLNKDARHIKRLQPNIDKLIANWDKVNEYNTTAMPDFNFPIKDGSDFYTEYVNYKSAMMDLDQALGILFTQLKEKNLLENTTICMFSDHYAYYNDFALQIYGYDHNDIGHPEIYNIPAFIYDVKMAKKLTNDYSNINELYNHNFCGPDALLPTVLDILGISYNANHYLSCSVFDDNILYYSQVSSLSGFYDKNFFSFNIFDIEGSTVDGRVDYNNLKQRFYCNSAYAYAKMKYLDNLYIYNREIFKEN